MNLNFSDPLTWVGIISTLLLGSIIIYTIGSVIRKALDKLPNVKKAGPVEFTDGNLEEVISQLKARISGLEVEDNQLKARLFLLESVHRDSIGFKQRARKMALRFEDLLRGAYLELVQGLPELSSELAPRLDEFIVFKKTTTIIRKDMLLKAMDDLDNNGFHKVAKDADGNYNSSTLRKYLTDKVEEYKTTVRNVLRDYEDVEPVLLWSTGKISKKPKNISFAQIDTIFEGIVPKLEEDIKELYMFAVSEAEDRQKRYFEILHGKNPE